MRTQLPSALLAAVLASVFFAVPANAQAPRTFVSAAGSDSNPCSFAAPCRHFQAAVNATSAGGEVDALDPAGYGPITITQAIAIEGQGWSYIAPPAGGNGITINAGSGNVGIHGVSLNGAGITGPTNGIVFNSGGGLIVADCVMQNFSYSGTGDTTGNGILMQPSSGTVNVVVTNSKISNNGWVGIYFHPETTSAFANIVVDHVVTTNNSFGMAFDGSTSGQSGVAISNSVASNNTTDGIYIKRGPKPLVVSIDSTSASNNLDGIEAFGFPDIFLGRSVITSNITGINNQTSPNTFYSYQDNRIDGNGASDISGTALNTTKTVR